MLLFTNNVLLMIFIFLNPGNIYAYIFISKILNQEERGKYWLPTITELGRQRKEIPEVNLLLHHMEYSASSKVKFSTSIANLENNESSSTSTPCLYVHVPIRAHMET